MKPVTLYKPASVAEATQILAHHGPEAAVYAGGTDLLVRLKNRLNAAPKYLVDIKGIGDLHSSARRRTAASPSGRPRPSRTSSSPSWWRANTRCWWRR